jgi:diacylglycerol kinase (ATP)
VHYIFVVSSRAGTGRLGSVRQSLRAYFPEREVSLIVDPSGSLIDSLCRDHRSGGLRLIAVGGDGTVHRLLTAAVQHDVPIGILPHGTANDLARTIGLKRDVRECCRVIRAGRTRAIDLVAVNGRLFATCGGLGLPSCVAIRRNCGCSLKRSHFLHTRFVRKTAYLLDALHELSRNHAVEVRIDSCGPLYRGRTMAVVFSNQARFGVFFSLSPKAVDDDGVFDLCAIPDPQSHLREAGIVLRAALGRGAILPGVVRSRLRRARILTDRVVPFFGDGEILTHDRDFRIEILPQAVRLIVPERAPAEEIASCVSTASWC